jgi:thioredoxin 1
MNSNEVNKAKVEITESNFESEVLTSEPPVLVAFVTTWSRPCAVLLPVLDQIASECDGKLKIVRVDADKNLDLSLWYDVQSIPTLLYFVAGAVRSRIVGTATKEAILSKLETTRKAI